MKENRYDDEEFFQKYSQMSRSQKGLSGAGEWSTLKKLLPDFAGKRVLDLGCGYGWHCIYAAEQGAASVIGVDLSDRMLSVAREKTKCPQVRYQRCAIEDIAFLPESFDVVLSSLALHYVESFEQVAQKVAGYLVRGGRVTPAAAALASVLKVRPVLSIRTGQIEPFSKERGMKKAVAKMFSAAKHDAKKEFDLKEDELVVGVASAGIDPERELEYLERAKAEFPDAKVFFNRLPFSVAVHTGPGALGIGIHARPKQLANLDSSSAEQQGSAQAEANAQ